MASKMITIAFLQGGIIPASVLNQAKDRHCDALDPVSVPEFYGKSLIQDRIAVPAEMPAAVTEKASRSAPRGAKHKDAQAPADPETLLRSSVLPALVEIAPGKTVQLGEIVAKAHENSGLSIEEWNALLDADRDARLAAVVDALKAAEAQQQA